MNLKKLTVIIASGASFLAVPATALAHAPLVLIALLIDEESAHNSDGHFFDLEAASYGPDGRLGGAFGGRIDLGPAFSWTSCPTAWAGR